MHFTHLLSAALLAVGSTAVAAAEMPRYDVEAQCGQVASLGGNKSPMMMNSCMDTEQSAYDSLKGMWAEVPDNIQKQCDQVASLGGAGSYMMLEQCIKMETQAASKPKKFKY